MDGVALLETEVRELVRRRGIDPNHDGARMHNLVQEVLRDYEARAGRGVVPLITDTALAAKSVLDAVSGLGPLQQYLDDPEVEEIWINSPSKVFVARNGEAELTTTILTRQQVRDLVEQMLKASGRRLDLSSPFVDAALPGGERLHVVIPDITREEFAVNIRKYVVRASSLTDMVELNSLTSHAARFLDACVRAGLNILVAGATQAGKTTMLNALAGSIPAKERVVTCEEVFELRFPHRDIAALQCRQPSLEGTGEIPLRRLVKEALRMRPNRIIIGEVREAESLDMLIALNSGVPGMCTLHANNARDAVAKICTLPLLAGENVTAGFVTPTVAASIDIVVQLHMNSDGLRQVTEIVALPGRVENGIIESTDIFSRAESGALVRRDGFPPGTERFNRIGCDINALLCAQD